MSTTERSELSSLVEDWELKAIVSSTWRDLHRHRAAVQEACLTARVVPIMMEHLLPQDVSIVEKSLEMVDQADIYIGLFGLRYGTVPAGGDRSVTEIEFDRAKERRLEKLLFTASERHRPKLAALESTAESRDGLRRLKEQFASLLTGEFTSVHDLKFRVLGALEESRRRWLFLELQRALRLLDIERRKGARRREQLTAVTERLKVCEARLGGGASSS